MSLQDQFDMSRIPIKPLPYLNKAVAQKGELMVDHAGPNPTYHLYIVDPTDATKIIDITSFLVKEAFGNSITVNIEGIEEPISLHELMNFIYKRFTYPDDPNGFNPERDRSKILDPSTQVVLLRDIDGICYLPITRADSVFDENGNSIQERLDSITRLGFAHDYLQVEVDDQQIFEIEYPFENYTQNGNYFELRIGTVFVDKSRYQVIDKFDEDGKAYGATITFFNDKFERNRRIDILYIYNATGLLAGEAAINGGQIAYHSINSSKLEKVVNTYNLPDETALVSAKALYDLYNEFIAAINDTNGSSVYCLDTSDAQNIIDVNIRPNNIFLGSKYIVLHVLTKTEKTSNIVLNVMHGDSSTQNNSSFTINVPGGVGAGRMMRILVNSNTSRVLNITNYYTTVNRFIYTCVDQEVVIPYNELNYNTNSFIKVYRNGVRLFEDLDYSKDSINENITLFVRTEEGERIVFEAENVEF